MTLLQFSVSAEVYKHAYPALVRVRHRVVPFLNETFASTSLATLDAKLRYVPIVMPEDVRERYPARSKLRKKERLYDCAPQLDFEVFVSGTFEEQLREYIRGIAEAAPYLPSLGADQEQTETFATIMATAVDRMLAGGQDLLHNELAKCRQFSGPDS